MATNSQPGDQNGITTHRNQFPPRTRRQQAPFSRPFTLSEALPYTPLTSVIPFDPDLIPIPSAGSGSPALQLGDLVSTEDFESLNNEARNPGARSKGLEESLATVRRLLDPKTIPEFIFKPVPRTVGDSSSPSSAASDLAPFSKMVFDQSTIAFAYRTRATSDNSPHRRKPSESASASPRKTASVSRAAARAPQPSSHAPRHTQAQVQNAEKFEIVLPTKRQRDEADTVISSVVDSSSGAGVTTQTAQPNASPSAAVSQALEACSAGSQTPRKSLAQLPETPQRTKAIAIELPSATVNKEEYQVVVDYADEPVNLSARKRKREDYDDSQDMYGEGLDQRQRADAAFQDLRRCVQGIFEAESQVLGSQSGANATVTLTNDNQPTITADMHQKLQRLLQKTISLGCFEDVPLDDLLRLIRLSEGALKQAEAMEIRLDSSLDEAQVDGWLQQLPDLEVGLRAARTCLSMMCGGRQDRQLYSEDLIQLALDLFKNVLNGVVLATAELRSSGSTAELFKQVSRNKEKVTATFSSFQKLFSLLTNLITSIDTSETVTSTLEFASSRLIFVENAHSERDSVVDLQKFDSLRMVAMDMLSQIFLRNPSQRQGIFDDILTSLEKLPVGKQRARQFKLSDGRSIQPVSALIMRLVQASAGKVDDKSAKDDRALRSVEEDDEADEGGAEDTRNGAKIVFSINTEEHGAVQHSTAMAELQELSSTLTETAKRNANYVTNFIVNRALKSTKSGDTPYRNLLDLFVEDFTTCLDTADWPAAELLLRLLTVMMVRLVEGERTAAPAKNMALEILGVTGAAISKLRSHVRKTASALDAVQQDELGLFLSDLATSALEMKSLPERMVSWSGPYRATLEQLVERSSLDPHLASAISYLISEWATRICTAYDSFDGDDAERDGEFGRLAYRLRMMVEDRRWLSNEYTFKSVSTSHAKLAYAITLLRSQLCESFGVILNILLKSMASDQATVRSKSLKSINQVLETDPSILDGESVVVQLILQCSNDSSPQVRDSAVGLIGKCVSMRPALEDLMTGTVVERFNDAGVGVRKRAMKLARDIYLRNHSRQVRSAIAMGLFHRVQDPEESVRDLARQVIEEIWITPFHGVDTSAASLISLADHVALVVQTVKQGVNVTNVLDKVLQAVLAADSKATSAAFEVCKKLVASMFDLVGTPDSDDPSVPSSRDVLPVLMIFAKADPKLFTFEQIRLLRPHVTSEAISDDMTVARAVVVIYRLVLPQLPSFHADFLEDVRKQLLPTIHKVPQSLADDIVACLWVISSLLNATEYLARLLLSSLKGIDKLRVANQGGRLLNPAQMKQFAAYSQIAGLVGKHCDLETHLELFKDNLPKSSAASVSKLMVDILVPFASPSQPLMVRKPALHAIGLICQSSPRTYRAANVYTAFQQVFDEENPVLEAMVLRSFKEFLLNEEKRSEQAHEAAAAIGSEPDKKRELTVMGGTSYDDVASATTQRFLGQLTRIALATLDDHAFLAVEILATINRQGLVHPKETGVTLITLETSPVNKISELAFQEHKASHEKHETVLEREYIKAIQAAFCYQRDVALDPRGATTNPFTSKLHLLMEVLKISKPKSRQRFLDKMCAQMDFDTTKLDVSQNMPGHVQFSRFVLENMAFFEYQTIGELQATVASMEKLVSSTGASVAHAIETEVFHVHMNPGPSSQAATNGAAPLIQPHVDLVRLRQLTAGSMILHALWEARTYLRRLYSMGTSRRDGKVKAPAKDLSKTPVKAATVTGDKFWEDVTHVMSALSSHESMISQCKAFVELLNVDKEFKVPDEDEELNEDLDPTTPPNDDEDENQTPDRGRKRKAGSTPGSRKKQRARSGSQLRKRGRPRKQTANADPDLDVDFDMDDVDWA